MSKGDTNFLKFIRNLRKDMLYIIIKWRNKNVIKYETLAS